MRRSPTIEELSVFWVAIGKGIWFLQYCEDALTKFLTIRIDLKTPGSVPEGVALEALKKRTKGTLGGSLKAAREAGILSAALEQRLEAFLDERNWLVHRSLDADGHLLYTDEGRKGLIERVLRFIDEAKSLQKIFALEIESYTRDQGVNTDALEHDARQQVANLRGEA